MLLVYIIHLKQTYLELVLEQEPIKRKVAIKLIRAGMEHHLQQQEGREDW